MIEPRQIPLATLGLRTFGGLVGGLIGTALIVVIAFLGSGVLSSAIGSDTGDGTIHPLFIFVFLAMMFIGSCAANITGALFVGLADRSKYARIPTTLTQIFAANLFILILVAPVYMVIATFGTEMLPSVAGLQVVVSAFASALILEILAAYRYALLGVYSTVMAVLFSSGIYLLFYQFSSDNPLILLFLALPVMWGGISFFGALFEWLYGWIYKMYGTDFLSSTMKYGDDVSWVSEQEKEEKEEAREMAREGRKETGADFLNKSGE